MPQALQYSRQRPTVTIHPYSEKAVHQDETMPKSVIYNDDTTPKRNGSEVRTSK